MLSVYVEYFYKNNNLGRMKVTPLTSRSIYRIDHRKNTYEKSKKKVQIVTLVVSNLFYMRASKLMILKNYNPSHTFKLFLVIALK